MAICAPASADAKLPKGATAPTADWLVGGWVVQGAKCAALGQVYLRSGNMGSVTSPGRITILGRWSLRGNILTEVVESKQYGDLVEVTRIGRVGRDQLFSDYPNNTNPDITILPKRRCPDGPGVEPWFPKVRFKGIATYKVAEQ
jgi:hypothetical protein